MDGRAWMGGWLPSRRKTGTSSFVHARRHNRQMIILAARAGEPLRAPARLVLTCNAWRTLPRPWPVFDNQLAWCNGGLAYSGDSPEPCNSWEGYPRAVMREALHVCNAVARCNIRRGCVKQQQQLTLHPGPGLFRALEQRRPLSPRHQPQLSQLERFFFSSQQRSTHRTARATQHKHTKADRLLRCVLWNDAAG
jgi:hypothetical protein